MVDHTRPQEPITGFTADALHYAKEARNALLADGEENRRELTALYHIINDLETVLE